MSQLEAGIGSLLTWDSVRSLGGRGEVRLAGARPREETRAVLGSPRARPSERHFAREMHGPEQRTTSWRAARAAEAICERALKGMAEGALTFDMSGGAKAAKQALGRPLDGGVRRHVGNVPCGSPCFAGAQRRMCDVTT
jgi:hypothetical protein